MRGARMGNSFIPPRPVEPLGVADREGQHVLEPPGAELLEEEQPAAEQPPRKKSASLFERITGQIRSRLQDDDDTFVAEPQGHSASEGTYYPHQQQPHSAQQQAMRAPQRAMPQNPAQGRLNIDSPSKPAEEENPLDIPAFLRRQSS